MKQRKLWSCVLAMTLAVSAAAVPAAVSAEETDSAVEAVKEAAAEAADEFTAAADELEAAAGEAAEAIEEEAAQAADAAGEAIETVKEEAAEAVSEAAAAAEDAIGALEDEAAQALDEAGEAVESLEESADEALNEVSQLAEDAQEEGEEAMDYFAMMAAAQEAAAAKAAEDKAAAEAADSQAAGAVINVSGFEWGPGIDKVILELAAPVDSVDPADALVNTNNTARTVTNVYLSDDKGEPAEGESSYVTLELLTNYTENGSPFNYDFMVTMQNSWVETYPVIVCVKAGEGTVGYVGDCINSRMCPDAEVFDKRGEISGDYANPMTGETDSLTLRYAAYEPQALKDDGVKNPLLIWLHGQGEGGKDPDIALLGNEVVALAKEPIQSYFTSEGGANGIYVLAVQTETYWMDGGDGTNSAGDVDSRYTEILMDAIRQYVDGNEDLDTNRIYLGGCSNGGYMTMNMLVHYPDYWAAAYPNCEAYAFNKFASAEGDGSAMGGENDFETSQERWMTDEKIEAIKDIPMWFAQSADDTIVNPAQFALPTYQALLKAGASNAWFSFFETVNGVDDPEAQYMGHWVWTYLFNDKITAVQDPAAIVDAEDELFGFVPTNDGGGTQAAVVDGVSYDNIFVWLNAQKKG